MRSIYINYLGINNSAGADIQNIYRSLFIDQTIQPIERQLISGRQSTVRGVQAGLPAIHLNPERFDSRNNRLLLHAVQQIESPIRSLISKYGPDRIGVVLGTSTSGIFEGEKAFIEKKVSDPNFVFPYYKQEISNPSDFLSAYLGLHGISYTISTACTSSAKALIEAYRLLQCGFCDVIIAGGVDCLSHLPLEGFDALESLAPGVTNPFSRNRNGINLGEGAAIFILSHEEAEVRFLGYGESSDAYHISSPDPEGVGAELALRAAMKMAKIDSSEISYVNLHATGTPKNDAMESQVMKRIFKGKVAMSGTKPFIGHTLGAAGAQEAAICWMTLSKVNSERLMPVHRWDGEVDPEVPVEGLVKSKQSFQGKYVMSNSFAFGGNDASLILAV